jgi:hypothetical protein
MEQLRPSQESCNVKCLAHLIAHRQCSVNAILMETVFFDNLSTFPNDFYISNFREKLFLTGRRHV